MTGLSDSFQRPINYLRVSVTDRCNLRCFYCMPKDGVPLLPKEDFLTYEELTRVVEVAVGLGITKVRITGGEPLIRAGILELVGRLGRIEGLEDLALTTNGVLLAQYAERLKRAGLKRGNVSLDSLRPERFQQITGGQVLGTVLEGIEQAKRVGLEPVKINTVVIPGVNDDELVDFALKTREGWHGRFIELMPFGQARDLPSLSVAQMVSRIEAGLGPLLPATNHGGGPAKYFRLAGASGTIGFISPVSQHFCFSCNRLRLTATGKLRLCLLQEAEVDLRGPLRRGASQDELRALLQEAVARKPLKHSLQEGCVPPEKAMTGLGG